MSRNADRVCKDNAHRAEEWSPRIKWARRARGTPADRRPPIVPRGLSSRDTGFIMPFDTEAMRSISGETPAPGAHALSFSTRQVGTPRPSSSSRTISRWCPCRPHVQSSIPQKTSGNTCARPIYRTACSKPTPPSSMRPKTPGESSSKKTAASHPSQRAIGLP